MSATSASFEAPYAVGAVEALCASKPDQFGQTHLDWNLCQFTMDPVDAP